MITTYSGLLTELTRLIDGEDTSASEIPVATLSQIVHQGELRIYREVRTRYNQKNWGVVVASNLAALPSDFIAPAVVHFGQQPLEPVSENQLLDYLAGNPTGNAKFFAVAGGNLQFGPAASGTVLGRYYYKMDDLSDSTLPTNTLFAAAEDLFIYASLAESAPFFGQDARLPMWEAKYTAIKETLNRLYMRSAYSAGRIQRSPSTRLIA